MATCRYCKTFQESKQKNEPKNDDTPKGRRVCSTHKKWVSEVEEMCEEFISYSNFWCDKLQQCMDIDSCLNRVKNKLHKKCRKSCAQYGDVLDVMRMRARSRK